MKNYKDLDAWKLSIELVEYTYQFTKNNVSNDEKFGLISQMRRASVSVASNIAEGSFRSTKEFVRFIDISLGSLAELETQFHICSKILKTSEELSNNKIILIRKMLFGLRNSLLKRLSKVEISTDHQPLTSDHNNLSTDH